MSRRGSRDPCNLPGVSYRGVRIRGAALVAAAVAACTGLVAAAPAPASPTPLQARNVCGVPGERWQRAYPETVGMDAAKLQEALDYGTSQMGFAVHVYRRGCLVGEDRAAPATADRRYESWSMAKSVSSLLFGRAMTLGLISPDDPVGSLLPEADRAHGDITMHDLLTMTSGLRWNGWRDYNVFTMPDRVRDALTLEPVHEPGAYFEYAQSTVALLVKAVERAAGEDALSFLHRELLGRLQIEPGDWMWKRDPAGNVEGFYGVQMRPDDFARLGELLRRGGVWRGRRLLSREYLSGALAPSERNGCYGWLIWVNAGAPCIAPTVGERGVRDDRMFAGLPADMYKFSGLFGQLVTVFPSQELMVVRTGHDPALAFAGGSSWERGLYDRVLAAITDQEVPASPPATPTHDEPNTDYGFQTVLLEPDQWSKGFVQDPLPPAGPERARAPQLRIGRRAVRPGGRVVARLRCPPRWLGPTLRRCEGTARLTGARRPVRYSVPAGGRQALRFRLNGRSLARMGTRGAAPLTVTARNSDAAGGTTTTQPVGSVSQ